MDESQYNTEMILFSVNGRTTGEIFSSSSPLLTNDKVVIAKTGPQGDLRNNMANND